MKKLAEYRSEQPEGVMVSLVLDQMKQISEENGIIFGDIILEELGELVRERCQTLAEKTGRRAAALRLNRDEIVLWLEGQTKAQAAEFARELLEAYAARFSALSVPARAGLALADREPETAETEEEPV